MPYEINPAQDTVTALTVTDQAAVDGTHSAFVTLGPITGRGASLSQNVKGVKQGATYTFAAFVRAIEGTAKVRLEIERAGSRTQIWVVPTNEELIVARQTQQLLRG